MSFTANIFVIISLTMFLIGFIGFINDAGGDVASYIAVSDGVRYWTASMTKATD